MLLDNTKHHAPRCKFAVVRLQEVARVASGNTWPRNAVAQDGAYFVSLPRFSPNVLEPACAQYVCEDTYWQRCHIRAVTSVVP